MGIICEFYRLPDEKIIELTNQEPYAYIEYLDTNYSSVSGAKHTLNTVFDVDKTWVTVTKINNVLKKISMDDFFESYNEEKMKNLSIHNYSAFHQDFIETQIETVKLAFRKSAESQKGFIINIG